jgi:glycosyltransferase involved in cell wall biosynthesis
MPRFFNKDVQFIFCSFVPTGLEDYVTYFSKNFKDFVYLRWRFPHGKGKNISALERYINGKKESEKSLYILPYFGNKIVYFLVLPAFYFLYFWQALFLLWTRPKDLSKSRIFMGVNYIATFYGIILKKLGRVDYVIYRVMDFFPLPKEGPYRILNRVFYVIDKFCLKNSDSVWFTTEGHLRGREKYGYFDRSKTKYLMMPLSIDASKVVSLPSKEVDPHTLVYCGTISKYHMVDLLLYLVTELKKTFPSVHLRLIGTGPDEEYFKKLVGEQNLKDNITFYGYLPEGPEFIKIMSTSSLGVAFYRDVEDYIKYTEPAKVKFYLTYGVPVLVSDVPVIAKEVGKEGLGISVKNDLPVIAKAVKEYFGDNSKLSVFKENIRAYIPSVYIENLMTNNLDITLKNLEI